MGRDVGQVKRIDVLPDDILLEIFDFYLGVLGCINKFKTGTEAWHVLVHVCRRWRNLVFGSPCRLNLRLFCTPKTPAKDTLDVWPALPLIVWDLFSCFSPTDNVIAILGRSERVREVTILCLPNWKMENVMAEMQVPFPKLTVLRLSSFDEIVPDIPDSFLGGSAPSLQSLYLHGIPFPGLPKLLLSTTHLISLSLTNIPHSWYISPKAIVALISELSSLESLSLEFDSPLSHPDRETRSLPPLKRSILPALNRFYFKGVIEYLEKVATRIDTPLLHQMQINFLNQIDYACPRLAQFINCTSSFRVLDRARVQFDDDTASVNLCRFETSHSGSDYLRINILCGAPDRQLSSIEKVCNSLLHALSTVKDLYIALPYSELVWKHDATKSTQWLRLLLSFTMAKNLYLSKNYSPDIAAALKELVGGRVTEVLPSLQNIFMEGFGASGAVSENIGQFAAVRRLSGHPIAISDWDKDKDFDMTSI